MKWSYETPTKVGWYWERRVRVPQEVTIIHLNQGALASISHCRELRPEENFLEQWAGPIPAPIE